MPSLDANACAGEVEIEVVFLSLLGLVGRMGGGARAI